MDKTEALILIVEKIFHEIGTVEQSAVKKAIEKELRNLNNDLKTQGHNGAIEFAKLAEKITGDNFLVGNGFD